MTITRDQFIRGFNAIKAAYVRRDRLNAILVEGNDGHQDVGLDPAVRELEQQLVDRCRDHEDADGPWPENSGAEGDISLGLCPLPMTIHDEAGNRLPHLTTAEDIWAMWERTSTGPFRPVRGAKAATSELIDFEHERATRWAKWVRWSTEQPSEDLVVRLRGEVRLTGGDTPPDGSKFFRRGQTLCMVPADGGSAHLVQPPYGALEWMPG